MKPRVLKFGGTSLADSSRISQAEEVIIEVSARQPVVVVPSAPAGVTDALASIASDIPNRFPSALEIHRRILNLFEPFHSGVGLGWMPGFLAESLSPIFTLSYSSRDSLEEARDLILGLGERLMAQLLSLRLTQRGVSSLPVDATSLIRTDSRFGEARVDRSVTQGLIRGELSSLGLGKVRVVGGFIGADAAGRSTTLGRGGSDYTASLIGAALRAEAVEIWTDVPGFLSADNRQFADTRLVPSLSYPEAENLARLGAKVLHKKAVAPAAEAGVPLAIRSYVIPEGDGVRGSWISANRTPGFKGIALRDDVNLLSFRVSSPLGRSRLRRILPKEEGFLASWRLGGKREALLVEADRTKELEELIRPRLAPDALIQVDDQATVIAVVGESAPTIERVSPYLTPWILPNHHDPRPFELLAVPQSRGIRVARQLHRSFVGDLTARTSESESRDTGQTAIA